jgi:hypothetical protein
MASDASGRRDPGAQGPAHPGTLTCRYPIGGADSRRHGRGGGAVVEARGVVVATVLAALMLVGLLGYAAGRYQAELFPESCDEPSASAAACR